VIREYFIFLFGLILTLLNSITELGGTAIARMGVGLNSKVLLLRL
jgi:hypothetical protein